MGPRGCTQDLGLGHMDLSQLSRLINPIIIIIYYYYYYCYFPFSSFVRLILL